MTLIPGVSHGQAEDFQKERAVSISLFVEFFLFWTILFVFGFSFLKLMLQEAPSFFLLGSRAWAA